VAEHLHFYPSDEKVLSLRPRVFFSGLINCDLTWSSDIHRHNFCEIMYISEGEGKAHIENEAFTFKTGDVVIYNTGVLHLEKSMSDHLSILFFAVGDLQIPGLPNGFIIPADAQPVIESGRYDDVLKSFLLNMVDEHTNKKTHYKAISTHIASMICYYLLRLYDIKAENPTHIKVCEQAKKIINANYHTTIDLDTIVDSIHFSKHHFVRVFRETVGMSPMRYLLNTRLSAAKDLLGNTDMPIQLIANNVGYENALTFSRVFKNNENISPTEYRNSIRSYRDHMI